ncbi:hypothetical protein [Vibrio phage vB_VhaS-tm]|nr:hypothetical protein [Vibrio phage vB_VhaS-tm]
MDSKLKARLMKLVALTESNNEYEAGNAMSRLKALCMKHGVHMEDLLNQSEEVSMHWFRYDNPYVKQVLINTVWKATNITQTWKNRAKQRQVGIECTKSQAAEIELWWSVMRQAFKQHLEDATSAFIMANALYGESDGEDDVDRETDWDALERQAAMANGIQPTPVHKGIEHDAP